MQILVTQGRAEASALARSLILTFSWVTWRALA